MHGITQTWPQHVMSTPIRVVKFVYVRGAMFLNIAELVTEGKQIWQISRWLVKVEVKKNDRYTFTKNSRQ